MNIIFIGKLSLLIILQKEIQLDTRNFSPVLKDTIPNIDPDVNNTSFRGRGHYSTIDSTDTDKDDFICEYNNLYF
jgi:hypothetical protein